MRSNVSERFAFGAHPRSRAHADTRAQRRADLRWTDCSDRVLCSAAPTRSPSRPDGSRDLDEERQMRSNVSERFAFGAHPRSRAHADTRAQRRADLRWTDCSDRVLCCAAPCAVDHRTFKISGYRTLSL